MPKQKGIQWDKQPLGTMTDAAMAQQLGVCHTVAYEARVCRGIPSYRKSLGRHPSDALTSEPVANEEALFLSVEKLVRSVAFNFAARYGVIHYIDDLMAEARLQAILAIRRHRPDVKSTNVAPFVARGVKTGLHHWLRSYSKWGMPEVDDQHEQRIDTRYREHAMREDLNQYAHMQAEDNRRLARRAIARLPDRMGDAVDRVYYREQTHETAAAEVGVTRWAHCARVTRALRKLRTDPGIREMSTHG